MEKSKSYINAGRASITDLFHHRIIGFQLPPGRIPGGRSRPQLDRLPEQAKVREQNMKHFETRLQNTPALAC